MRLRRSLVPAFIVVLAVPAIALANVFVDSADSVHEGPIEAIAREGITKGCNPPDNDQFCPDRGVTRGEMAAFLVRALDLPDTATRDFFDDDNGSTFERDINRLADADITKGCNPPDNDRFCWDDPITRGQMAAFLARALSLSTGNGDPFVDDDGHTFEEDIEKIAAEGITKGCNPPENDRYCPEEGTTRGEMASFLTRALDLEIPPTDGNPDIIAGGEITGDACPCHVTGTVELKGTVNLRGDLMVHGGTLVARPGVVLKGNGHEIMVMHGGVLDWRGTPKSGWVEWGETVSGWKSGDRIAVAPLAKGDFDVHYDTWTGSWGNVSPSTATLSDGTVVEAEVANLSRDITVTNVSRIMFHMGAGKQTLKHVAVRDSGIKDELGFYPVHFHLNNNSVRGSLVEGVVVENGQNHAFVPHGSNDIAFVDVAAVNTVDEAFWWDRATTNDPSNNSDDILWQHALVLGVSEDETQSGGFQMGGGRDNTCIDCHAAAVQGGKDTAGFIWPEFSGGQVPTEGVWLFENNVAHNNSADGIFVWQNTSEPHVIANSLVYRNDQSGIDHGAYNNTYRYENIVSLENGDYGLTNRAFGRNCDEGNHNILRFYDVTSDGALRILQHHQPGLICHVEYHRLDVSRVVVDEQTGDPGRSLFYDSNLEPNDFVMLSPADDSIFQIFEGGQLVYEWADGSWSAQ